MAEAGYVQKPAELFGETNPKMAKVAERVGFTVRGEVENKLGGDPFATIVTASYSDIKKKVFSKEALRLEAALSKRLVGELAANNSDS